MANAEKTFSFVVTLTVPREAYEAQVREFVESELNSGPGHHMPEDLEFDFHLVKIVRHRRARKARARPANV